MTNNKSTGVEILTDDEVGTVSSEDPHGHMSLFLHHQHEQQTQHFQRHPVAFDLKNGGPVHFGFRSLSSDARTGPKSSAVSTLFAGEDDPPLLMSSIDGVTTQVLLICCIKPYNFLGKGQGGENAYSVVPNT